jgi:hypothetical protein
VSFQLCCNPSWRRKRRPRGWTTEDSLMWAEALMSLEILGCCHLIQYRGVYLGRAKCHCCHLTSVPVYWIRPCVRDSLGATRINKLLTTDAMQARCLFMHASMDRPR